MNYIIDAFGNAFKPFASFFSRIAEIAEKPKAKENELLLQIGRFRYTLSNTVSISSFKGAIEIQPTIRWKKRHGKAIIIPSAEANPHILIFGMSGQGKSTLLRSMIKDIGAAYKPAIIFDAHNEHEEAVFSLGGRVIDSSRHGINIFSLDGSTVGDRIAELSQLFKSVYSLGYVQSQKLAECMWYAYRRHGAASRNDMQLQKPPSMSDVLGELSIFIANSRNSSERSSLAHLRSKLSSLSLQPLSEGELDVEALRNGISSFSLAGIRSAEAQIIYINELLRRIYTSMKMHGIGKGVSLYIVIDEAQFIINDSDSQIVKKLMQEGRKYGVGVILATHMASSLPREIIANSSTFISFYSREPQEVNYISNIFSSGIGERAFEVKKMLRRLRKNEAIAISYNIREPSVIETPRVFSKDGQAQIVHAKPAILVSSKPLLACDGEEYENVEELKLGEYDKQERWVMKKNKSLSIEHEVMVKKIFQKLEQSSIKSIIIDNSNGPDLVAYVEGRKIAIEYETGRKSVSSTSSMIKRRLKDFDHVIIVVNDGAFNFYSNYFAIEKVKVLAASSLPELDGAIEAW
ncbi:MAG: ATP-binding protein [Candidatus Micrarchaeia archaeon]